MNEWSYFFQGLISQPLGPNGECEYIEENEEAPFGFERFYNEALYLKVILERVRGYEAIFEETLSEKEIYDIIK